MKSRQLSRRGFGHGQESMGVVNNVTMIIALVGTVDKHQTALLYGILKVLKSDRPHPLPEQHQDNVTPAPRRGKKDLGVFQGGYNRPETPQTPTFRKP